MKRKLFLGFLPVFCLVALPALVYGQVSSSLAVADGSAEYNQTTEVAVTLDAGTDEVQGVQAIFERASDQIAIIGLLSAPGLDPDDATGPNADTVVLDFGADHVTIGIVMDSIPSDNGEVAEILTGNVLLATAQVQCGPQPAGNPSAVTTDLVFVDGAYDIAGGPDLDNIVVVGGLSFDRNQGLSLDDGEVSCTIAPDKLIIQDGANPEGQAPAVGDVEILMNNNQPVEGFVTAVCHPAGLTLQAISLGPDAAQADFEHVEITGQGGLFGVVIDLIEPMGMPPNIPADAGNHIATYSYLCEDPPDSGEVPFGLELCDNVLGSPLQENIIVSGGLSINPVLQNGTFLCRPSAAPPPRELICDDDIDNDVDGKTDLEDEDCQEFEFEACGGEPVPAGIGEATPVPVCYNAPTAGELGLGGSGAQQDGMRLVGTQGFSLALGFLCDEVMAEAVFDIDGTILAAIGTEFISVQADNDPDDGDGCSLTLGVLIDALPPFSGRVIPPLAETQVLGSLSFKVNPGVPCGQSVFIVPEEGANGTGKVPTYNLISVENLPFPARVRPIQLIAKEPMVFFRGDCNFSRRLLTPDPVEIADAAAVISFLFQKSIFKFEPPCLDACDENDDGRIDLADAMGILGYLFIPGSPFPPDPGPGLDMSVNPTPPGTDPTPDPLDCKGTGECL